MLAYARMTTQNTLRLNQSFPTYVIWRSELIITGPEDPDQSNDDQIKSDDIVQQPQFEKNKNPGDQ